MSKMVLQRSRTEVWWTLRRVSNFYRHFSREGQESPAWLKKLAVDAIKDKDMKTTKDKTRATVTTKQGSHPMGRQLGAALLVVLCLLLSCKNESVEPVPSLGCARAISKTTGAAMARCCTREEFLAGSNVSAGGVPYYNNYKDWTWAVVATCKECQ